MEKVVHNNPNTKLQMDIGGMIAAVSDGRYADVEAMYEFVDNSIDANSTSIKIGVFENNQCRGTDIERVVISDNGSGMNPAELQAACVLGGDCNRTKHDIGDFGVGMQAAAFAMADRLIIATKTQDGDVIGAYMSRDQLEFDGTMEPHGIPNPTHNYQDLWDKWSTNPEQGTVIILECFQERCGFQKAKTFVARLRDRATLGSRYYYHLNSSETSRLQIELTRNKWNRGSLIKGYDRLHLNKARSSANHEYGKIFDRALTLPGYDNLVCRMRITEAISKEARNEVGSTDYGLAIYYNRVLITISKDWLGTRTGNASWRLHIRGALFFETKEEYEKVFSSNANKNSATAITGFGNFMADKYFGSVITDSIVRWKQRNQVEKADATQKKRQRENEVYVSEVLSRKRTFPHSLLRYQSEIRKICKTNLDDVGVMGVLADGVVKCNMDHPDISNFLSDDSEHRRRFGRALAVQDAIERDLRGSGVEMSSAAVKTFLTSLMTD